MTTFDEREKSFEKKFAMDQELKFKAEARRNKLFGLWIANKLGLSGDAAAAYARDVIAVELEGPGKVAAKITADLTAKNLPVDEAEIRAKLAALMAEAVAQVSWHLTLLRARLALADMFVSAGPSAPAECLA
jgi:hypothetical protein